MDRTTSFSVSLQSFVDQTKERMETVTKGTALELLRRVRFRTPVGNPDLWKANAGKKRGDPGYVGQGYVGGTLRANWQISHGAPKRGTISRNPADGRFPAMEDDASKLAGYTAGQPIYIVNNLAYAAAVEYGHSSKQSPAGMVGITIAEFDRILGKAAAEAKK